MTDIITTKDLTKNELSGAKILAAFAILVGLVVFLNSAQMEQKDMPEIAIVSKPTQATDGSGLVSFGVGISKFANYDLKMRLEYTSDDENYLPLILAEAQIDSGSLNLSAADFYQVSEIAAEGEIINLKFVWATQGGQEKINSDNIKIRITLASRLKDTAEENISDINENINVPADEPPVIIDDSATIIDENEVTVDPQPPLEPVSENEAGSAPVEQSQFIESVQETAVLGEKFSDDIPIIEDTFGSNIVDFVNNLMADFDENISQNDNINTDAAVSDWAEISLISEPFIVDNQPPRVRYGNVDPNRGQIFIYFNEIVKLNSELKNDQFLLQNEVLAESSFNWLNNLTLAITLSASEKEKYTAPISEWVLQINPGENIYDLFGNKFAGGLILLSEQKEETVEEEIKDEEEKKEDEIIIPENIKQTIKTRGLNQNCSFNPDDFIMSAGETRETTLSLTPRDPDSKFVISSTSVPEGFEVKIPQSSGTGNLPVTVLISAPAEAAPRLYKILLRYEDFTPQSVSYVNNCVLRLTVQ